MLTPVGVLGVRGTHFRARTEDGQALTEVLDGRVAVNRELTSDDLPLNGRRPARRRPSRTRTCWSTPAAA